MLFRQPRSPPPLGGGREGVLVEYCLLETDLTPSPFPRGKGGSPPPLGGGREGVLLALDKIQRLQ